MERFISLDKATDHDKNKASGVVNGRYSALICFSLLEGWTRLHIAATWHDTLTPQVLVSVENATYFKCDFPRGSVAGGRSIQHSEGNLAFLTTSDVLNARGKLFNSSTETLR